MRLVLFISALLLGGCATTTAVDNGDDAGGLFGFRGDGGNIQVVAEYPVEVCTAGPAYIRARMEEGNRHCTMLGEPGAMHSDALVLGDAAGHQLWIHEDSGWSVITIDRCNRFSYEACGPEEFDLVLHQDGGITCSTRWSEYGCHVVRSHRY